MANAALLLVGLGLMIAGVATKKYGALVVGLIVAAVNARQLRAGPRV